MRDEEKRRAGAGASQGSPKLVVLCATPHLDWDWRVSFEQYYTADIAGGTAVHTILNEAADLMRGDGEYIYSVAEVGYLQRFARETSFVLLQEVGPQLRILGGGITSPDNLLPHGETFLRNFLVGRIWVRASLPRVPPIDQIWLPDDFGHDSQLPVLTAAMGFQGVGFGRLPPAAVAAVTTGSNPGVDFVWRAADGSEVLAHFMQKGYGQGGDISSAGDIETYIQEDQLASTTGYIFVPVGNDFSAPKKNLLKYIRDWNAGLLTPAVAAGFDDYIRKVAEVRSQLFTRSFHGDGTGVLPFPCTPYWTGFYATRPALKQLHHAATRALLGAEIFGVVAGFAAGSEPLPPALQKDVETAWAKLVPSTHHDYITGTAAPTVYRVEQLGGLGSVAAEALGLRQARCASIASRIPGSTVPSERRVVLFNQCSAPRGGLVEMDSVPGFDAKSVWRGSEMIGPVQRSYEGKWLFFLPAGYAVPGLGYGSYTISNAAANMPSSMSGRSDPDRIELANSWMVVTLEAGQEWGIGSLVERTPQGDVPILSGPANKLVYYNDGKSALGAGYFDVYMFGYECGDPFGPAAATFVATSHEVVEHGPVRVRAIVKGTYQVDGAGPIATVREYALVADEPFLRMSTQCAAPSAHSIFVDFPLAQPVVGLGHGTPYHWDFKTPQKDPTEPPIFEATHDFVIAYGSEGPLGTVYHADLPAWAVEQSLRGRDTLRGCLLRNVSCAVYDSDFGWADPDAHTFQYTFALPRPGADDPRSGIALGEAQALASPLAAVLATGPASAPLPPDFSVAQVDDFRCFIMAVKPGSVPGASLGKLVLRIYQSANEPLAPTLTLPAPPPGRRWTVSYATALEEPLSADALSGSGGAIVFMAERALTTLLAELVPQ